MDQLNFDISKGLLWIVLFPLAAAVINGIWGRSAEKRTVTALAIGSVAGSFILALLCFYKLHSLRETLGESAALRYHFYDWFSVALPATGDQGQVWRSVPIEVNFVMDSLSAVMTLLVTGVGLLIHIYSAGYMHDDPGYPRFFCYLNLFTASMLILVLASSFPVMFVGWEGVGLCSYLLIGFWWENRDYAAAGRKAFVVNRIGDFGVLIGMFILFQAVGSFEFDDIRKAAMDAVPSLSSSFIVGGSVLPITLATAACLFLFLGCTGKSAQIPLYIWLPDAMAGPTPVSALIHAATMVTAGVYLCCRLSPLFALSPQAMQVIAVTGAATAIVAASIALVQNEIKKILAYSTVSQLGFMFAAVGAGAFSAGIFHVFTHGFFKACLFLGAGSVMHAVGAHGDADIRKLGGLRHVMPHTHWTFLISCLAIAGFPLTSGFFSKDEILLGAASIGTDLGWIVYGTLVLTATLTAFYMFRLYFLTFSGDYRGSDGEHLHESPLSMTVPLMCLGVGAVFVGWLNLEPMHVEFNAWGEWLSPLLGTPLHTGETAKLAALVGGLFACFVGIGSAYVIYVVQQGAPAEALKSATSGLHAFLFDKWRVDELYNAIIVRPLRFLATFAAEIDGIVVDGLLTRFTSGSARALGWLFVRPQNGLIFSYGAVFAVGMLGLTWWFVVPHPEVEASVTDREVRYVATKGAGYEYRWDANSDGTFETEWDPGHIEYKYRYEDGNFRSFALVIATRMSGGDREREIRLNEGNPVMIDPSLLGEIWRQPEARDDTPPAVRVSDGAVHVRPNAAAMKKNGGLVTQPEVQVKVGETFFLGDSPVQVAGIAHVTLELRNAFQNVSSRQIDVIVRPRAVAALIPSLTPVALLQNPMPPTGGCGVKNVEGNP